ncbi:hypothetical protein IMZ29_07040 [Achromobacter sp. GG226]|uniref:hypothetical protein n=1 Tax=Verticiella alkaliphila TaxID=2779529 RepID=UPI001C0CD58D|nr:hypothetical protein [Verticiella sp. GG226]MBU4610302.1 hypothetical protein [Verticiella sp. GG226]
MWPLFLPPTKHADALSMSGQMTRWLREDLARRPLHRLPGNALCYQVFEEDDLIVVNIVFADSQQACAIGALQS